MLRFAALLSRCRVASCEGRRQLCTAHRSHRFQYQAPADKQNVDDLIDGYDLSLSGEVTGDMPEGRAQRRLLIGDVRHYAKDTKAGWRSGRQTGVKVTGDYESFYHMRLPRVPEYEPPRQIASGFLRFNTVIYPPRMTEAEEEAQGRMPAETCVEIGKISIEPKALLLFGIAVQGMAVQPALDKLRLLSDRPDGKLVWRKFGHLAPLCLAQAIETGVRQMVYEESVEYESDMWVECVQVARDGSYTVMRKDARWSLLQYKRPYSVLRVRLREGKPPAYYHPSELPAELQNWRPNCEIMQREIEKLRSLRIYREM